MNNVKYVTAKNAISFILQTKVHLQERDKDNVILLKN